MAQTITKQEQQYLKDIGLYKGDVDGLWGNLTHVAVIAFQNMNGLYPDGILGHNTRAAIHDHLDDSWKEKHVRKSYGFDKWPQESQESLIAFYGKPDPNNPDKFRRELTTTFTPPFKMKLAWDPQVNLRQIRCHILVKDSFERILLNVRDNYSDKEIDEHGFNMYGGCFNIRKMRGGSKLSTHSWGCAVDIDPARNGLKCSWKDAYLSKPECAKFVKAFEDEGWYSLGKNRNYDAMHFQAAYRI